MGGVELSSLVYNRDFFLATLFSTISRNGNALRVHFGRGKSRGARGDSSNDPPPTTRVHDEHLI